MRRLGRIDLFDRAMILSAAVIVAAIVVMIAAHEPEARATAAPPVAAGRGRTPADFASVIKMIDAEKLDDAGKILRDALASGSSDAQAYALLADIASRRMKTGEAVGYYRDAVNMNPDYVDKRSPLFIGKKINVAANEAIREFKARVAKNGGDAEARDGLKTAYYLKRMIAGSCQ